MAAIFEIGIYNVLNSVIDKRKKCTLFALNIIIIIIIIKNFVCSPKGFSAYNYNTQFKIKLCYTIQNLSFDCLLKHSYI